MKKILLIIFTLIICELIILLVNDALDVDMHKYFSYVQEYGHNASYSLSGGIIMLCLIYLFGNKKIDPH